MLDMLDLELLGVFRDPGSGRLMRHRLRNTNFQYDPDDPQAELKGALLAYDQQLVPHPVILPLATDEASVREAQQKAINAGADFYHPQHGWLRWGRKRETERPENLGASTVRYETRRVVLTPAAPSEPGDVATATPAPKGAPKP